MVLDSTQTAIQKKIYFIPYKFNSDEPTSSETVINWHYQTTMLVIIFWNFTMF